MDRRQTGHELEKRVIRYLKRQGLKYLTHNYFCPFGEIDIIMEQRSMLVFIEVRYRRLTNYGSSAESVGRTKQQKLIKTAWHFLKNRDLFDKPSRFDIVALHQCQKSGRMKLNWIQNAFQPNQEATI